MKKVGITGPPGAGKTTVWRAITGGRAHGDVAAVPLSDERLDALVDLHSSKKRVPVQMEFVDVHSPGLTTAAAIARLREMDAIVAILPVFSGEDRESARRSVLDELILADMGPLEKRLERARKDRAAAREITPLEAGLSVLESGRPLIEENWDQVALSTFSPLAPLTLKPLLLIANVDEAEAGANVGGALQLSARLEAEVAGLEGTEAEELLAGYGVPAPASDRVAREVYRMLELITFFTINDEESRAWELRKGAKAPEAAGTVHTDMQRGFIRAEVCAFDRLQTAGSWTAAKGAGSVRVEGKDYVVADGDVIRIRFSV